MSEEHNKMNNGCALDLKQMEQAARTINSIIGGEYGILKLVEDLRNELTSREAETRAKSLDVVCYVLLKLTDENRHTFSAIEVTSLLDFLLSKMEDSGHLAELLIATIHKMITRNFRMENENPLQDDQLEQILSTLFINNNAQSYGQKDRIILYSIFEHLLNIQSKQLLSSMAQQKTIQYFLGSVQGEQDPRVLIIIFRIHQKLASQAKLGIFLEDMFDIISCYFPIDYEPNEKDKVPSSITSEMLHYGLEACLLSTNSFAPFCFQLICEKLMENDAEIEGLKLINRQLDICKFFINACKRFTNIANILEGNLEELMVAFRSIFLNPAQNRRLLNRSEEIITEAMQNLVKAYSEEGIDDVNKIENLERIGEKMMTMTLENIEPFILQAEMGTMGGAFRMVKCLYESTVGSAQSRVIWQRCLYWLDLLINGKTLRSPQNRKEIALEAIELMPYWLRKCTQQISLDRFEENRNLMEETLHPILGAIFSMKEEENEKLLKAKCQVLNATNLLKQNEQFSNFFHQHFQSICNCGNELICSNEVNQFLAKYAENEFCKINDKFFDDCLQKGQFNILPPIVFPFPSELEGERTQVEKTLQNSIAAINVILTMSFQFFFTNRSKIQSVNIQRINECCQAIENTAKRLNSCDDENEKTKKAFYNELKTRIDAFLQSNDGNLVLKSTTTIFDSIAILLQSIGESLLMKKMNNLHNALCKWAIQNCKLSSSTLKMRTFWLLLLQTNDFQYEFIELLLQSIRPENNFGYFDLLLFEEALCSFYFAIYNGGKVQPELREQIILALNRFQQNQSNQYLSDEEEEQQMKKNEIHHFINFNLFKQNSCPTNLRIELLEMRSSLLMAKPIAMKAELIEFFDKIISDKEMNNSIDRLLDFFLPQNDPAKCFYQKSPSWQQKIFTIFVPIYVQHFAIIRAELHPKEKKMQFLTLVGPLMQIFGQIHSTNSLTDELMQLGPLIVESLPITIDDDDHSSLTASILDGLSLLLKRQKAMNDGHHFTPEIVHSIGLCICKRICRENLPLPIIFKMLECLQILPNQFEPEWLAPVCVPVVQALAEMASHPKRFIRQRVAGTRNSWELIF